MAETKVYGCDWCGEIVEKRPNISRDAEVPKFAAKITAVQVWPFPAVGSTPDVYDICAQCQKAFRALTEGKFRR